MTPSESAVENIRNALQILDGNRELAAREAKSFILVVPDYEAIRARLIRAVEQLEAEDRELEAGIIRLAGEASA